VGLVEDAAAQRFELLVRQVLAGIAVAQLAQLPLQPMQPQRQRLEIHRLHAAPGIARAPPRPVARPVAPRRMQQAPE
jgi:hypothetical protein